MAQVLIQYNKDFMKKAFLTTSFIVIGATVLYYFLLNQGKAPKSEKAGKGKSSFKYIGERTHNSLHEVL
ncbi:MAG: hypothetical protein NVS1B13_04640 [Flavisolibacter sp.]